MAKDIVQIARDAFPFGDLRKMLDLLMGHFQAAIGAIALRKKDVASADEQCHHAADALHGADDAGDTTCRGGWRGRCGRGVLRQFRAGPGNRNGWGRQE